MASYQDTVGSEQHSTADLQCPALQEQLVPSSVTWTGAKSCLSGKNGTKWAKQLHARSKAKLFALNTYHQACCTLRFHRLLQNPSFAAEPKCPPCCVKKSLIQNTEVFFLKAVQTSCMGSSAWLPNASWWFSWSPTNGCIIFMHISTNLFNGTNP